MYNPQDIEVPHLTPGEHNQNPPHFQLTQKARPDFSSWREPDGNGMHGFHSHLHNREELAKDIAIYYGMISLMDKYIGVILDKLDELGLAGNTLVVFTTDHGHFYGHHGLIAKGAFHYEDMIKLPMIARLPGRIPAGRKCPALQTLVDFAPTFLSIAQQDIPRTMTGLDQCAVWFGEEQAARDHIIVENRHQPTTLHLKTFVNERYKLTVYYGREYGELFDLVSDPGEVNNLWADPKYANLKAALVMRLLQAEMGKEPVWMPRIAGA
jgi:uncharacterized sulfatase